MILRRFTRPVGRCAIENEQYRERRYGMHARIELTEIKSERQATGETRNISTYGCAVVAADALQERSKVRLVISYQGMDFAAIGRIVYTTPDCGTGIAFLEIDPRNQAVLDGWLAALKKNSGRFRSG